MVIKSFIRGQHRRTSKATTEGKGAARWMEVEILVEARQNYTGPIDVEKYDCVPNATATPVKSA